MFPAMLSKFDVGWQIEPSDGPRAYIPQCMQIVQALDLQGIYIYIIGTRKYGPAGSEAHVQGFAFMEDW